MTNCLQAICPKCGKNRVGLGSVLSHRMRPMNFSLTQLRATVSIPLVFAAALCITGCSGRPKNFAKSVTGKVTVGGKPLAGATIVFTPVDGGSPSMGRTDENGTYKLYWGRGRRGRAIEGAQIGNHSVSISTFMEGLPTAKPPRQEVPEKVPYKYRAQSPPTATVKAGANTIDFDLEAGPVEAPPQPKGKTKGPTKLK
jgi:hypothetical protein